MNERIDVKDPTIPMSVYWDKMLVSTRYSEVHDQHLLLVLRRQHRGAVQYDTANLHQWRPRWWHMTHLSLVWTLALLRLDLRKCVGRCMCEHCCRQAEGMPLLHSLSQDIVLSSQHTGTQQLKARSWTPWWTLITW